jgi:ketosteroid isomerase-like protein
LNSQSLRVAATAALLLAAACQAAPQLDAAADEAAVLQLARDWAAAEASNDDSATVSFLWEDAVYHPPGSAEVVGRAAIKALYGTVTFESLEVGAITVKASGDLAVTWGPMRVTFAVDGVDDLISDDSKFVAVWERRDGVWKVIENAWNSSLAPTGPPEVME